MKDELDKWFEEFQPKVYQEIMTRNILKLAESKGFITSEQSKEFLSKSMPNIQKENVTEFEPYVNDVINKSIKDFRKNELSKWIDKALENNDKDLFIKLTNELKTYE